MAGRVRRKAVLAAATRETPAPAEACALCGRMLGARIEWHHVVPKSEGGRDTVPLHPICHRSIHAAASNAGLARRYPSIDLLRGREDIHRFVALADKPADFHAPTRRKPG